MTAKRLLPDQVSTVLWHAADLIEQYGWWNGKGKSPPDRFCAVTAICQVCPKNTELYTKVYNRMRRHVRHLDVTVWNDKSDAQTVIAGLRAAALS